LKSELLELSSIEQIFSKSRDVPPTPKQKGSAHNTKTKGICAHRLARSGEISNFILSGQQCQAGLENTIPQYVLHVLIKNGVNRTSGCGN
jgi:hypothetical protein